MRSGARWAQLAGGQCEHVSRVLRGLVQARRAWRRLADSKVLANRRMCTCCRASTRELGLEALAGLLASTYALDEVYGK
jgi:hypothetical protein